MPDKLTVPAVAVAFHDLLSSDRIHGFAAHMIGASEVITRKKFEPLSMLNIAGT